MRKILVTGGAGFIASYLAKRLLQDSNNLVVCIDNFLTSSPERLPLKHTRNFKFVTCDVNELKQILPVMVSYSFDYVFHFAAVVGVKRTLENPVKVLNDIQGINNILELSKSTGVKRVFFSSSSEIYGEPVEFPQNELTTPLNSRLPYAVVKNVGEAFLCSYKKEFDLDYTIFRFFNTYGPMQSSDFVMTKFIRAALKNDDITIYGDGSQTRTFCYIKDNVDACVNALYREMYVNDVVNIGSDEEMSILELSNEIIEVIGSISDIVFLPPLEEGDMKRRKPDISKMNLLLDREPLSVTKGIGIVAESLRDKKITEKPKVYEA